MKKLWLKKTVGNIVHFELADCNNKIVFIKKNEITKDNIVDFREKTFGISELGDFAVGYEKGDILEKNSIELPPGIYSLQESTNTLPTRLEVCGARKDGYIPMQDQTPLIKDINRFIECKDLYLDENIKFIYRRGYLLYGEPGTGKTALIRNMIKNPVFKNARIIWSSFVPPTDMTEALNHQNELVVFIIEELLNEVGNLNFDMQQLLTFLDGENSLQNCITIATTNYPQFMHKNLADRPSRFDVLFEVKSQSAKVLRSVFSKWLKRDIQEEEIDLDGLTLAHMKEIYLLHKFHGVSLKEAASMLKKQSDKFKTNFQEKKPFGLMGD